MKIYILSLLLALSVLFNVFFAAGFMKARTQLTQEDADQRVRRLVAEELKLSDTQTEMYRRMRSGMSDEDAVLGDGIALVRQEMLAELNGHEPDLERLRTLAAREAELHRQRRLARSHRFREFIGMLDEEQRRRLSRHFRRGSRGRGPSPRLMEKFDTNRDGTLDESERAAFAAFVEERQREREMKWEERRRRFDTNGDGVLDPDERKAMREQAIEEGWHERGRGSRPGAGPGPGRGPGRGNGRRGERPGGGR